MVEKREIIKEDLVVQLDKELNLKGNLHIPSNANGIVLFAHGSGSSRNSPRNQWVASFLNDSNIATFLFDLLSSEEEKNDILTRELRFNIPLLAERLIKMTEWIFKNPETHPLTVGYFGASTGAAAALIAASELGSKINAVVCRGGRPDLALQALQKVTSPILLIVGANDYGTIELNQMAFDILQCNKKLEIVPGATHLFEEQGALEEVGRMASIWFMQYL